MAITFVLDSVVVHINESYSVQARNPFQWITVNEPQANL